MRVRTNFTVSCNVVTDVLIPDDTNLMDKEQMKDRIEESICDMLYENVNAVLDQGGCLIVDAHSYSVVK